MRLLSWNVQWCRGVDGRVDPARIASEVRRFGVDVGCFQEIAANFPELPGSEGEDQPAQLARELPGYQAITGWAVDVAGTQGIRKCFGNMIVSRYPVERVLRHSLPWPAAPELPSMPRIALEVVVQAPFGALRLLTTHLEYYSAEHRAAQVQRLADLHREANAARMNVKEPGPFQSRSSPASTILCGDFNLPPHDPLHWQITEIGYVDAWQALNRGRLHAHTFRVHEREKGQSPYCCDFVFVTPDLVPRLAAIRIDGENRASDHQPVIVELR